MENDTHLKPGKVRTSKLGFETLTLRIADKGFATMTYDPESKCLRVALGSYDEVNRIELLRYDRETLEVKL